MGLDQLQFSRGEVIANELVRGDAKKGEAIGQIDLERIQRQIDALVEFKIIDQPVNIADVATTGFLPPKSDQH
jgi:hypothetical protein